MVKPGMLESMILLLVYQGVRTLEGISRELNQPEEELARLLDRLEITGYLVSRREGVFKRHNVYRVTDQGLRVAFKFKERAERDFSRASKLASQGLLKEARSLTSGYASYLGALSRLGIINQGLLSLVSSVGKD